MCAENQGLCWLIVVPRRSENGDGFAIVGAVRQWCVVQTLSLRHMSTKLSTPECRQNKKASLPKCSPVSQGEGLRDFAKGFPTNEAELKRASKVRDAILLVQTGKCIWNAPNHNSIDLKSLSILSLTKWVSSSLLLLMEFVSCVTSGLGLIRSQGYDGPALS